MSENEEFEIHYLRGQLFGQRRGKTILSEGMLSKAAKQSLTGEWGSIIDVPIDTLREIWLYELDNQASNVDDDIYNEGEAFDDEHCFK